MESLEDAWDERKRNTEASIYSAPFVARRVGWRDFLGAFNRTARNCTLHHGIRLGSSKIERCRI